MKQSRTFIPTIREIPATIETGSQQLLCKAGYIRTNASGVYTFLPLGQKVVHKLLIVIREEMETMSAAEVFLPTLQQAALWQESNRWTSSESTLFTIQNQDSSDLVLGDSYMEMITSLVKEENVSYKKLPLLFFQLQTKYKNVKGAELGLLQSLEFLSKDGYSFHENEESLHETYEEMKRAYSTIFTKLGLNYRIVPAETTLDAANSHKFIALSSKGDDIIAYSDSSSFAASIEFAEVQPPARDDEVRMNSIEKIATPDKNTVKEVSDFLDVPPSRIIKTLLYKVDHEFVAVLSRGDHEVNESKLLLHMNAKNVALAQIQEIREMLSVDPGSIGPVKLPVGVKVVADHAVGAVVNGICGANETDFHLMNVNPDRDFAVDTYLDLRTIQEGDPSPDGQGTIRFAKGITVGHVAKVGTLCSAPMKAGFQNRDEQFQLFQMASYSLDITRLLAALADQFHDGDGLKWPKKLAPYDIHLITVNCEDDDQFQLADELYRLLRSYRYDILHDDREERAGVKFTDADLIGIPIRITIGKKAPEGIVEIKFRETGETVEWQKEELTEKLQAFFTA